MFLILTVAAVVCLASGPMGIPVYIADRARDCGDRDVDTIITVLQNGGMQINGARMDRTDLAPQLQHIFGRKSERLVFVNADPNVPFQDVADVIDIAQTEANYVALLTPAVETQSGCLTIHLPPSRDINFVKPILEMKKVPLWSW